MNTFNQLMALAEDIKLRDYNLAHRCQEIARGTDGWIKVEDGLPESKYDCDDFLIVRYGDVFLATWNYCPSGGGDCDERHSGNVFTVRNSDSDYGGMFIADGATHWQPLPTPPAKDL